MGGFKTSMRVIAVALCVITVLFVVLPVAITVLQAGPAAIADTLAEQEVLRSFALTFWAALIATALAFVGGLPLAYVLARRDFVGKRLIEGVIDLPIIIPHTAAGIALLTVFGRRGLLGSAFAPLGIFFTDRLAGIVVAMLFVSLPLFVDSARAAISQVDVRLESTSRTLGASQARTLVRVTLPLAWRGILSGLVLMWARGVSEFGAVAVLAYNPKVVPVLVYERFVAAGLDSALPVTAVLLLVSLVVLVVLRALPAPGTSGGDRR